MPDHPIVVVGASAGGVEALVELVKRLPPDFAAAVFVAVHFPASSVSLLPQILSRLQTLPAHHPIDGEAICPGQIYIAPPNYHLIFQSDKIQSDKIRLSRGPRENGHRPAIDVMFRSAAHAFGDRVIGVVLTGMLDDGTAGLLTIKAIGGKAIVQDPNEALFDAMPRSAIDRVSVDWVLKLTDIAQLWCSLCNPPLLTTAPSHRLFRNLPRSLTGNLPRNLLCLSLRSQFSTKTSRLPAAKLRWSGASSPAVPHRSPAPTAAACCGSCAKGR